MEAIAKHDFRATADDELSFAKNNILKILSMDDDQNWFKAELDGKEGYVPNNYIEMKPHPWFAGKIPRLEAERRLLEKDARGNYIHPDGAFLLRNSESAPGEFSISVKVREAVQHFKVLRDGVGKYYLWVDKYNSVNDLIEFHKTSSVVRGQNIKLVDLGKKKRATAQYEFKAETEEELGFSKGDVVTILEEVDSNWWKGELHGQEGLFPAAYVRVLDS
ncbi:growth factor receptor-bound protein 2-like isoform X2 [Crassostrea angulata]|uniref:Growth factor receptor-bound protein 2 n=1 Tax=Magallana gigas TaxID=29159 RepID=A0A8W8NZN0_MAGGI|nr:protein enhancer of sevenless 2B isoform X2 [Crassostrea gigas]XP_052687331.1 growth factor receptor-bound protein 2-like isoform X2 [Crassostrea angulata]|eukprot:XP_011429051.1 PREDICTED: protein enhancer of sevenless 2B isoform X2 [Crassostrea gigas]